MSSRFLGRMRRLWFLLALAVLALLVSACGGAAMMTPTPIPASVVRPEQPTPLYSTAQPQFRLEGAAATPVFAGTVAPVATLPPNSDQLRAELLKAMLMNLPPSAMGIATGGATIYAEPGANVVGSLPAGRSITVTGRSADGNWLAVYTNDAVTGWVAAGSLRLFGADDLENVDSALSPAPVATMIAEAMQPPALRIADVIATRAAAPNTPPPASTSSAPVEPEQEGGAFVATVATQGNLNLRQQASAESAIVAPLPGGSQVVVLGRNAAGDWLQVRTPVGDGWLSAQYLNVEGDPALLPVMAQGS